MVKIDGGGGTIFLNLLWSQCPGIKMDRIRTVHAEHRLQDVLITVAALRKRCAGFKASDFNIQELRTAIRQVIMLWFIPEEIQISLSQWNVNYESYEWIWNSISRQGPMFCRLPWPTLSQLHANENPLLRRFLIFYIHVTTSPPSVLTVVESPTLEIVPRYCSISVIYDLLSTIRY